jgi:hypothetical protein
MKLSKALLSALLVGVTVQTITSCNKKDEPKPVTQTKEKGATELFNCPACGMG